MAKIYRFPVKPEESEEQQKIWDEEIQAIMDEADRKAEKATAYICDEPADNPFEQMERERLYNELKDGLHRMATEKPMYADMLLLSDVELSSYVSENTK